MKVAIHQPNYIPWIGFFDKLDQVDLFVILDMAHYSKTSFVNRNYIKTPKGAHRLTVPIGKGSQLIHHLRTDETTNWRKRHWKIIENNYRRSPYFEMYHASFKQLYEKKWESLFPFNMALLIQMKQALQIDTKIMIESDFHTDFGKGNTRNVQIVKAVQGSVYLSGVGARAYNEASEFIENGIRLEYQHFTHPIYPQRFGSFIPNLSMMDMLFNCGPDTMEIIRKERHGVKKQ